MPSWKNNKIVGIIAGIVVIICIGIIVKVILGMRPKEAPPLIEQVHAVEPNEQVYIP